MSQTDAISGTIKLESDLLRTFLAIAETGSISAGAERIFRSQSAASLQIKRLEDLIGQPLFARHGRGVVLTTAGEELRPVAQRVIGMLDAALDRLRPKTAAGRLRIGVPEEYGQHILPRILGDFSREFPSVELSVRCAASAGFAAALQQGELEIAIYDVEAPQLHHQLLARQRTVWATSRRYLAHEELPLPLALFDRDCWWRNRALQLLAGTGKEFRTAFASESVAGVVAAISAGMAVGMLGAGWLNDDLRELTPAEGFPELPTTCVVLDARQDVDARLAAAMFRAIRVAFAGTQS